MDEIKEYKRLKSLVTKTQKEWKAAPKNSAERDQLKKVYDKALNQYHSYRSKNTKVITEWELTQTPGRGYIPKPASEISKMSQEQLQEYAATMPEEEGKRFLEQKQKEAEYKQEAQRRREEDQRKREERVRMLSAYLDRDPEAEQEVKDAWKYNIQQQEAIKRGASETWKDSASKFMEATSMLALGAEKPITTTASIVSGTLGDMLAEQVAPDNDLAKFAAATVFGAVPFGVEKYLTKKGVGVAPLEIDESNFGKIYDEEPVSSSQHNLFRLGDVEINNPRLNYRQGRQGMSEDFLNTGEVTAKSDQAPIKQIKGLLLSKTFDTPMFAQGFLWYGNPYFNFTNLNRNLLVTAEPLQFATKNASPAVRDIGGRRIPFSSDQLNLNNTVAFTYVPGYGYLKMPIKPIRYIEGFGPEQRVSTLSEAERAGIPKGERNQPYNPPVQDFGEMISNPETYSLDAPQLGKYIGDGEEAIVFANGDLVYKVIHNPIANLYTSEMELSPLFGPFNKNKISEFHKRFILPRNKHAIFEPYKFEGIIHDTNGAQLPVVSQRKLTPALKFEDTASEAIERRLNNQIESSLLEQNYQKEITPFGTDGYRNENGMIFDIHPWNVGYTPEGKLRAFDLMVRKQGGKLIPRKFKYGTRNT